MSEAISNEGQQYFAGLGVLYETRHVRATSMYSDITGRPTGTYLASFNNPVNNRWDQLLEESRYNFEAKTPLRTVVQSIANLPGNYRTNVDLSGWPLGFLCHAIRTYVAEEWRLGGSSEEESDEYAELFMRGLTLTGICRNYETDSLNVGDNGSQVSIELYETNIIEYPLERISFFDPSRAARRHSVTGYQYPARTLQSLIQGDFASYLFALVNKPGGSDMSLYQLWDNCVIARRTRPPIPSYMFRRHGVTRTGGFGNLLLKDYKFTFIVDNEEFKCYIPSGIMNCFDSCLLWGYKKVKSAYPSFELNLESELEMSPSERHKAEALSFLNEIKDKRCAYNDKKKQEYEKKYQKGYTSQEMKLLSKLWIEKGFEVTSIYLRRSEMSIVNTCETCSDAPYRICIFRMTDKGTILWRNGRGDTSDTSGLLHAISVYPYPEKFMTESSSYRKRFIIELEKHSILFMEKLFAEVKYKNNLTWLDLQEYVEYQQQRHADRTTKTLIFHRDENEDIQINRKRPSWRDENQMSRIDSYVFAYDLETVQNNADNQHMVYEPFQCISSDVTHAPLDIQIPFSAQWVPVNVSDSERFAERKIKADIIPRREDICTFSPTIEEGCVYSRVDDVLLDKVVTEYGDYQLGKCVDDMLLHIAEWVHRRGGKYGYLFAHNGVGFDSYIVLQFTRYKVKRILKTPRGLLSMSIRVTINEQDKITLHLRDTKVHVPGSLANLCKSFNVPKVWVKLDFPIGLIHAKNCYKPEVMSLCKPYGENDVKCLAYIVKRINETIMESEWDPAVLSNKPPICQFLTVMSLVKASTFNHFVKTLGGYRNIKAQAVDIPVLRTWLVDATFGGRVNAYGRTFMHYAFNDIMKAYMSSDIETLKQIHSQMLKDQSGMQVLDVTSLYPTAQAQCPMPCGEMYFASIDECEKSIQAIHCAKCEAMYSLCPLHNYKADIPELRPFVIIIVKNCIPGKNLPYRCMTGRKIHGKNKTEGLEYSLETKEEMNNRFGKEKMREQQSYSNVDLYWMRKQGYTFTIIGGFGWRVCMTYQSFIEPAFLKRIEAKRAGNKILSNTLKLMYNSTYGVTAQKDIMDSGFIKKMPEELNGLHHSDERVMAYMNANHTLVDCDEYLDNSIPLRCGQTYFLKKKKQHLAEYYGAQSPIQIGCAVLAWSRHIMNLIMFAFPVDGCQTYTDTDSICINDSIIQNHLKAVPNLINNATDAFLGSLKNDHLEGPHEEPNGKEPRVVLSLIGTKKVKLHVTLNELGEIKFFNTFKGLNPSCIHPETKKRMNIDYVDKIVTDSIIEIHKNGNMPPVMVSQWSRSMNTGIIIGEHLQTADRKTYLGHSAGSIIMETYQKNMYEHFIPHGISPRHFIVNENTDFIFEKKNKNYFLSHGDGIVKDDVRIQTIENNYFKYNDLMNMVKKYYSKYEEEEKANSIEYKKIVEILLKE